MSHIAAEPSSVCIANIGPRERKARATAGIVGAVLVAFVAVVLVGLDAPRWARIALLLPIWGTALSFLQAREKT